MSASVCMLEIVVICDKNKHDIIYFLQDWVVKDTSCYLKNVKLNPSSPKFCYLV